MSILKLNSDVSLFPEDDGKGMGAGQEEVEEASAPPPTPPEPAKPAKPASEPTITAGGGSDAQMIESYVLPIYSGILAHRKQMGMAIYEFIWCIDKITKEYEDQDSPGRFRGLVLGGEWVKYETIAADLDVSRDTVKLNLKKLADGGYLALQRKPWGSVIEVLNSKKWNTRQGTSSPSVTSSPSGQGESPLSDDGQGESSPSRQRTSSLSGQGESSPSRQGTSSPSATSSPSGQGEFSLSDSGQGESSPSRQGTSSPSNRLTASTSVSDSKPVTALSAIEMLEDTNGQTKRSAAELLDIPDPGPAFDRVVEYIMVTLGKVRLNANETNLVTKLLLEGVAEKTITDVLDETVAKYAQANNGRYFNSFCYCENPIRERHELLMLAAKVELSAGAEQTTAASEELEVPEDFNPDYNPDDDQEVRELLKQLN